MFRRRPIESFVKARVTRVLDGLFVMVSQVCFFHCIVVSPPYNIKCLNWLLLWFCINKIILNWIELNVLQSAVFGWSDFFTKHQWRLTHGLCCQTNLALFCLLGNIIVSLIAWYHYNTVYHRKSCIHTVKYVKNRSKFWKIEASFDAWNTFLIFVCSWFLCTSF